MKSAPQELSDIDLAIESALQRDELDRRLQAQRPKEAAMWEAIKATLKADQATFVDFDMYFGECPPGHELRPKRDGKRAPFALDHFAWVREGAPRRVDVALRGGQGIQAQINELRARVEALEAKLS